MKRATRILLMTGLMAFLVGLVGMCVASVDGSGESYRMWNLYLVSLFPVSLLIYAVYTALTDRRFPELPSPLQDEELHRIGAALAKTVRRWRHRNTQ